VSELVQFEQFLLNLGLPLLLFLLVCSRPRFLFVEQPTPGTISHAFIAEFFFNEIVLDFFIEILRQKIEPSHLIIDGELGKRRRIVGLSGFDAKTPPGTLF
jgi:hypothetical protein